MTDEEARFLDCGLYRLHWVSGGPSLAAVGQLHDGRRWFAPVNWTADASDGVALSAWQLVARAERLAALSQREYDEIMAVFGDRVLDSEVARLAVLREREACAKEAQDVATDNEHGDEFEAAAVWKAASQIASYIRARGTP